VEFLDRFEDGGSGGDEFITGLSARLVLDRLLQIVVEIFIRVVFRRRGRHIKNLNLDLVARQPILNVTSTSLYDKIAPGLSFNARTSDST